MKPIVTQGTNSIFGADGYEKLPAEVYTERSNGVDVNCIQTAWQLTDEEFETLKLKKIIYISVVGEQPQPIDVSVAPFTGVG